MNPYIQQLKTQLAEYKAACGSKKPVSVLEQLWENYGASNLIDNRYIRKAEAAIEPIFNSLSVEHSDILFDLINELCTTYQRTAFLDGIQIGTHLISELDE